VLEEENARLKRLLAEKELELQALAEIIKKTWHRSRPPGMGTGDACTGCIGADGDATSGDGPFDV